MYLHFGEIDFLCCMECSHSSRVAISAGYVNDQFKYFSLLFSDETEKGGWEFQITALESLNNVRF